MLTNNSCKGLSNLKYHARLYNKATGYHTCIAKLLISHYERVNSQYVNYNKPDQEYAQRGLVIIFTSK